MVSERCSCGAELVDGALFCHRCGKPQREILEVEAPPPVETPPTLPPPQGAPPISFHNGLAVRIGLLAGLVSFVVLAVIGQIAIRLFPLWLVLGGFLAVFLYRRRTGQRLSAISGAHLGWMSGVFVFVVVAMILTALVLTPLDRASVEAMRDQWRHYGRSDAELDQFISIVRNPRTILVALPFFFLLFTVLPAFGGAIGAKLLNRD